MGLQDCRNLIQKVMTLGLLRVERNLPWAWRCIAMNHWNKYALAWVLLLLDLRAFFPFIAVVFAGCNFCFSELWCNLNFNRRNFFLQNARASPNNARRPCSKEKVHYLLILGTRFAAQQLGPKLKHHSARAIGEVPAFLLETEVDVGCVDGRVDSTILHIVHYRTVHFCLVYDARLC